MTLSGLCLYTEEASTFVTHPAHAHKVFGLEFFCRIGGTGLAPLIFPAVCVGSCLATVFQLLVILSHIFNLIHLILHP